jgi:hypothetical protein
MKRLSALPVNGARNTNGPAIAVVNTSPTTNTIVYASWMSIHLEITTISAPVKAVFNAPTSRKRRNDARSDP